MSMYGVMLCASVLINALNVLQRQAIRIVDDDTTVSKTLESLQLRGDEDSISKFNHAYSTQHAVYNYPCPITDPGAYNMVIPHLHPSGQTMGLRVGQPIVQPIGLHVDQAIGQPIGLQVGQHKHSLDFELGSNQLNQREGFLKRLLAMPKEMGNYLENDLK